MNVILNSNTELEGKQLTGQISLGFRPRIFNFTWSCTEGDAPTKRRLSVESQRIAADVYQV